MGPRHRSFSRLRAPVALVILVTSALSVAPASAGVQVTTADPDLSTTVDFSGTGSLLTTVRTKTLRASVPAASPRILIIGTGVQKALFPPEIQPSIRTLSGADAIDTHGYGTIAASTIFQLLPNATVTSLKVPALDASWHLLNMTKLAEALAYARANRGQFDLVLLAYPPQAALDPISHLIGHIDYGRFGKGMGLVTEALLATKPSTQGPAVGIPTDKALRNRMFARANFKQREAVEKFALQALAWRTVLSEVRALTDTGVGVIAPSGDFTRKRGTTILPLVTQTVFGLSALPEVITVGAAYADGAANRISPMSGRGPTLALETKPDLVAPSDVMSLLPAGARLAWPDDSTRIPLATIEWARAGVPPTPCPSVTGVYRCSLQGSSMVAASVAAANLATAVASGLPSTATARTASDDEILRGIAWAQASKTGTAAYAAARPSYLWEEGTGMLTGLKGFDPARTPVALKPASFGEMRWGTAETIEVPMWSAAAPLDRAGATVDSFLGPDRTGQSVALTALDSTRVSTTSTTDFVTLTASGAQQQAGFYVGRLIAVASTEDRTKIPMAIVQTMPVDFRVTYGYNGFQTGSIEGERVEDATAILFAGLPTNVGLVGEAFKNFSSSAFRSTGGDPTNSVIIRYGITRNTFVNSALPASEHGRGRIDGVPPGFYRFHLMSDHAIETTQARGAIESIGMQLASSGPDAATAPGSNLLVASEPPCAVSGARGPISTCIARDNYTTETDPETGLCVVRNTTTKVHFNVYCGEIHYAVPSAMVSRAVHLIEHDDDPLRSEWRTCGINVPQDGTAIELEKIVSQASACPGQTAPTQWTFKAGAPSCLGPTERSSFPSGHPTDVTAVYSGAGAANLPGRNLPVGVMSYEFKLPALSTYTTAGLALSYATENAIVAVRFKAGSDSMADGSSSLLVVNDPKVIASPRVDGADARGSAFNEWAVMSSNAPTGTLSLIVIPTAWARSDLDPTKPIASVQLCDVAMRVLTFAKQTWGAARSEGVPTQFFAQADRDLLSQIDPTTARTRPVWDASKTAFVDAGREAEGLTFAIQVPKNTTRSSSAPHHVLSPAGGPGYFKNARRWDGSARHESVLGSGWKAYDPRYGTTALSCAEGTDSVTSDPQRRLEWETCRLWNDARARDESVLELTPTLTLNGRFAGLLPLDLEALKRAAGDVAYEAAAADDSGAFDKAARWAKAADGSYVKRIPVGNFFDNLSPLSLNLLSGLIRITKDPTTGNPVLNVDASRTDGVYQSLKAHLY